MEYDNYDNENIDGLIQKIQIKNFLCHDNLIIDFRNSNVHWIIGRNGSGKSAILTALIVGLGGKAAATNRGSNIQSFIKKGANFATIEIRIKNNSQNAYNHDRYGDHITVIRKITSNGSSSYTVKAASGEVVSVKYAEVNNILVAHEIQVDNPISVLNQDEARTFSSIDPKKMYTLFRRATNLDHSQNNYQKVIDNCKKAIEIKSDKEKTCAQLEKEYKKWESKYRRLKSRDEMKVQIRALKNEIVWSEIAELKRKQNALKDQIAQQTSKCQKITNKLMSMDEDLGNNRVVIEGLMRQLEESDRAKTVLEREKRDMEEELRDVQEKYRNSQRATGKKRDRLNKEMRKVTDFEREIGNIESGGTARRRAELESAAESARAALEAVQARVSTAEHRLEQARAQHERAQAAARSDVADEHELRDRLESLRRRQRELQTPGGDPLAVWGAKIVELRRRIQQAVERGQFSEPPVGPVGHYLRLKDQMWANALEHIIGGMKTTFCVNNAADSRKLFQIMQEVYGDQQKPSVTCSRFLRAQHDVSEWRVRAQPCALDALDVSHPVVANFLIDNLSLETVLLVRDHEQAIDLCDTEENVPVNCSKVVTEDCTEFYPAPNYRSYGRNSRRSQHHYLQLGSEDIERRLREEASQRERALGAAQARAEAARLAAGGAAREAAEAERALRALLDAQHDAERARAAAERALDLHRSPQHDELEKELNISKKSVEALKVELEEATALENIHIQKIKEYENNIKQIKLKFDGATTTSRRLSEKITEERSKVDNGAAKRQNYERILKENQDSIPQMEEKLAQEEAVISGKVQQALQTGSSVENPRDKQMLQELLKATSVQLRAVDELRLDMDEVRAEMARAEEEFRSLHDLLTKFGDLIEEIQSSIDQRLKFCYQLEMEITRRVQFCFSSNLATHGYNGRIDVRHSSGELSLVLSARDGQRAARPVAALSGGERSYCTVALLLALWECVELPFYFLDEFDVFMDPVNRRIVVELLLEFARRRAARQFVLLAPLAPHALPPRMRPQLHRLDDPRP